MQHPRLNDKGQPVTIHKPSTPSATDAWADSGVIATATPDCRMPADINSVPVATWADAPTDDAGWEALGARATFEEPPMPTAPGKKPAGRSTDVAGRGIAGPTGASVSMKTA